MMESGPKEGGYGKSISRDVRGADDREKDGTRKGGPSEEGCLKNDGPEQKGSGTSGLDEDDLEKDGPKNDGLAKDHTQKGGVGDGGPGKDALLKDNLGKDGQEENGLVPEDNSKEVISISRDEESAEEEGTAGGSPKDSRICHMSDSTSSTKNDDNESEIDSVEDNAACLDHFFSEVTF